MAEWFEIIGKCSGKAIRETLASSDRRFGTCSVVNVIASLFPGSVDDRVMDQLDEETSHSAHRTISSADSCLRYRLINLAGERSCKRNSL